MAAPGRIARDLPRRLGMLDATAIVVGIVIGSGIFVLPNVIARNVPSYTGILAAWVIGGVLSFFGALAYAELGAMLPATGGQYVYLREAYGPLCAFVSRLDVHAGGALGRQRLAGGHLFDLCRLLRAADAVGREGDRGGADRGALGGQLRGRQRRGVGAAYLHVL